MACTLAQPGESDWTVRVRRRCDLFLKLLWPLVFFMVPRSRLSWLTVSLSALAKHLVSCCIRQKKSLPLFILSRSESRQVLNVLIRTGWPSWVHLASSSYISTWIKHRKTQGWRQEVFSRTVQKFLCGRESPATLIVIFSRRVQKFKGSAWPRVPHHPDKVTGLQDYHKCHRSTLSVRTQDSPPAASGKTNLSTIHRSGLKATRWSRIR